MTFFWLWVLLGVQDAEGAYNKSAQDKYDYCYRTKFKNVDSISVGVDTGLIIQNTIRNESRNRS